MSTNPDQNNETECEVIKPLDKWDCSAVKNRLDDAVKVFFTHDNKYSENFLLIDIRLMISLTAVGVAVFALVWDYLYPFPSSRPVLLICVLTYFVFMALLTLYTTLFEKGTFLKANKGPKTLTVSSYMKRFDDFYQLYIELSVNGKASVEAKLEDSVAKWFDESGYFLEDRFENELKKLHNKVLGKKNN